MLTTLERSFLIERNVSSVSENISVVEDETDSSTILKKEEIFFLVFFRVVSSYQARCCQKVYNNSSRSVTYIFHVFIP